MTNWHRQRLRERAYVIWEEEGRRHGNDLAHWFRAEVEIPLRITFDSNAYRQVVKPDRARRDTPLCDLQKINDALRSGRIRGYLSETLVTLEGIENKDRVNVLGSTRLDSQWRSTGENSATLTLAVQQGRKPLNPGLSEWIQAAREGGMRFLRAGSRWFSGTGHLKDDGDTFFEPDETILALAERMDRVNEVAAAIQARGLGYATAVSLGLKFSARAGAAGEWWLQGLQRARIDAERKEVQKAIAEWADADSIAAHVGYEIELFCSQDRGRSTGGKPSVLDGRNRAWLASTFGVKFVTVPELAAML